MQAQLYYRPKVLQVGELKDAFEKALSAVLGPEFTVEVMYPRRPSPGVTDEVVLDLESLRSVVDLSDVKFTMIAKSQDGKSYGTVYLSFGTAVEGELFSIFAADAMSFRCLEKVVVSLGLVQTDAPIDDLEALDKRVAALEKAVKDAGNNPKCFISFKFDDLLTVAQVNRLKRLLAAVHIEFLTGEQFEASQN